MFAMEWKLFLILSSVVVLRDCDTKLVERSLMNFAQMIRRVTATNPFKLIGYGNWCGFGGGGQVVDSVDSCCERHDNCYDRVAEQCGSVMADYMMSYDWKVENDTDIVCGQ